MRMDGLHFLTLLKEETRRLFRNCFLKMSSQTQDVSMDALHLLGPQQQDIRRLSRSCSLLKMSTPAQ
jgi:hypothetical protein